MEEPAMPTQGVVTKNSFGNRSVDKGITQPTNNKFRFIELYAQKLDSVFKMLRSGKTEGPARPKVRQDQRSSKTKVLARIWNLTIWNSTIQKLLIPSFVTHSNHHSRWHRLITEKGNRGGQRHLIKMIPHMYIPKWTSAMASTLIIRRPKDYIPIQLQFSLDVTGLGGTTVYTVSLD